tara:strand:- start:2173 stop:2535 length:363 start_codon:yes stop_codon:yes gene_type:complete
MRVIHINPGDIVELLPAEERHDPRAAIFKAFLVPFAAKPGSLADIALYIRVEDAVNLAAASSEEKVFITLEDADYTFLSKAWTESAMWVLTRAPRFLLHLANAIKDAETVTAPLAEKKEK